MTIKLICVGKLKESYFALAAAEYVRRLSRYAETEICEVPDEKAPETLSVAERERVKDAEGKRMLAKANDGEYLVALTPGGRELSSEAFSAALSGWMVAGGSRVAFMIGGSLGLSDEALKRANERIGFSKLTFPHQLFRIMLLEQIYRAFKIMKNEPYHK